MRKPPMKTLMMGPLSLAMIAGILLPSLGNTAASRARGPRAKLSTTMSFSGARVDGQYMLPSEATAKIENEKPIEELLGLRVQFRDRMKQDEERR
jgi:hypothetical protein